MIQFDSTNFQNKKVLIRVDFNVPINASFEVTDDTRIAAAQKTIQKILNDGGSVILMSHLGRPKDGPDMKYSMKHTIPTIQKYFPGTTIHFADDCVGESSLVQSRQLKNGEILVLENVRFYKEETKGDLDFAKKLSLHADIYINDAFGSAHREHASTATIAKYFDQDHKGFGYLMASEVNNASKLLNNPVSPVTAIVGGAKVSDKILLLEKLIETTDHILIGGGMAYTFVAALGGKIGLSIFEPDFIDTALKVMEKAKAMNTMIHLPTDTLIADKFDPEASTNIVPTSQIPDNWMGLDIGPNTAARFAEIIKTSKSLLWNGPMGVFEFEKFSKGTFAIAEAVAEATDNGAFSLIGGGDSVSAINKSGLQDRVSFVSTGGGAMLEFLEGKVLPGIKAIQD